MGLGLRPDGLELGVEAADGRMKWAAVDSPPGTDDDALAGDRTLEPSAAVGPIDAWCTILVRDHGVQLFNAGGCVSTEVGTFIDGGVEELWVCREAVCSVWGNDSKAIHTSLSRPAHYSTELCGDAVDPRNSDLEI